MNDFETRLAARFAALVDHEAGAPDSAPPFVPVLEDEAPDRRSRTRVFLVAAVVVVVAALTWAGLSQVIRLPGPQVAGPPTPSAGTTATAVSTAPSTSASAQTTSSVAGASTTVVGGMTLSLPAGWTVTPQTYSGGSGPIPGSTVWCIDPVTAKGSCTISLTSAGQATGNPLDVDVEGGWSSNPSYCSADVRQGQATHTLDVADVRSFGGRSAEYRKWTHTCTATQVVQAEMYEVAYAPAWILFSEHADSYVSAVMAWVAQHSTLPVQTLPLRLQDLGYVRSVHASVSAYIVTLDRVYASAYSTAGEINNSSTTYEYTIPALLVDAAGKQIAAPKVGDRAFIVTNGSAVTGYSVRPL